MTDHHENPYAPPEAPGRPSASVRAKSRAAASLVLLSYGALLYLGALVLMHPPSESPLFLVAGALVGLPSVLFARQAMRDPASVHEAGILRAWALGVVGAAAICWGYTIVRAHAKGVLLYFLIPPPLR